MPLILTTIEESRLQFLWKTFVNRGTENAPFSLVRAALIPLQTGVEIPGILGGILCAENLNVNAGTLMSFTHKYLL